MHTYTFIAEYKGGTYVRQASAMSIQEACRLWSAAIVQQAEIPIKNADFFEDELRSDLEETPPVCVEETPNVWFFMADAGKGFVHVNIIKTHPEQGEWRIKGTDANVTDKIFSMI